jgi:hypothetical protein
MEMFALNAGSWPVDRESPAEARDRYHRVALHEAQIASEASEHRSAPAAHRNLMDRVRVAIGLAPAEPACVGCAA